MRLLGRLELGYAMLIAWMAVAGWRMAVGSAHDDDGYGWAWRAHNGLLLLQGVLALLAGVTWLAVMMSARDRRRGQVVGCLAIFVLFAAAFAVIFAFPGLYSSGTYEN
ncbi:MAG TPA: hypothetical protein VFG42_06555 [Baekduia sp.]|uniref:hypothetical protein n=1 Tax=Baekduia sp. TaxID=2600305 RepID=UPI002D795C24|nr:hypothetical protein [Baekduia sp.]HET6506431.1 hypothetical protein [Baekduia sp.]